MGAKYLFLLSLLVWIANARIEVQLFNVKDYGAIADGKTDNSAAFLKAWNDACKFKGKGNLLIPQGTYMLNQVLFSGPCNGMTSFIIKGVLKAPTDLSSYTTEDAWIGFRYVNKLIVGGGGTLDGQGSSVWGHNDCQKNPNCRPLPSTMGFGFITNGYVHHLHSINSKQVHFVAFACENMTFTQLRITAPDDSPNTDGIKIGKSIGITITSVNIGTGDDCIAILSGTRNVRISDVFCGPGHGISVGSLGKNEGEEDVQDIVVWNCTFSGTLNGVRIKSWATQTQLRQTSKAFNIVYDDIMMDNVYCPIIIDQAYGQSHIPNTKLISSVQISDVKYRNIRGSGNTDIAVSFYCSENKPCQDITLENINLWRSGGKGKFSNLCSNVNGHSYGKHSPPSCL